MKRSAFLSLILCPGALALVGCGSQAATTYQGEPLATVRGSVILSDQRSPKDLVPALAFIQQKGLEIADVGVTGEFPARFTMDVFTPPPADIVFDPELGEVAVAFITAVAPDHPRRMPRITESDAAVGCDGPDSCTEEDHTVCSSTGACFSGHYTCEPTHQSCVLLSTSGDPEVDPFKDIAGMSRNYFLIYTFGEVPRGTKLAKYLNGDKPIAPGYHLVAVNWSERAHAEDVKACEDALDRDVWAEYDRQNGTTYQSIDDVPVEQSDAVQSAVHALRGAIRLLRPCDALGPGATTSIVDTWSQSLQIEISTDPAPPFFL